MIPRMPSETPFVDSTSGELDRDQLLQEAIPLAKLIALVVALSLVPFALAFLAFGSSILGAVVIVIGQFILAVGTGIVLMYVLTRAIQLADE